MKKIGIIGMGFVGNRLAKELSLNCKVITYDVKYECDYPYDELASCDFIMICVNTPANSDGSVYVDNVENAIKQVPANKILIRSTIPPGTTDYFVKKYKKCICFSPEYVGESLFLGSSWNAFEKKSPFLILGGNSENRRQFLDDLEIIYGPNTKIMEMGSSEAELVKYMENSYFALKVSFVNEFRELAESLDLSWNSIREGWLLDSRVERDHTAAFKNAPGYNGKCLPKDVCGIVQFAKENGFQMHIMASVSKYNHVLQSK